MHHRLQGGRRRLAISFLGLIGHNTPHFASWALSDPASLNRSARRILEHWCPQLQGLKAEDMQVLQPGLSKMQQSHIDAA